MTKSGDEVLEGLMDGVYRTERMYQKRLTREYHEVEIVCELCIPLEDKFLMKKKRKNVVE